MQARSLFLLLGLLLALSGCGNSFVLDGTEPSETTDYPAVVKVVFPRGAGMCTGTFVSPRAVLTAAHCVQVAGSYHVYASFGDFYTYKKYSLGAGNVADKIDLALLVFDKDVADPSKGQAIAIGEDVSVGEVVRLVGYGCNDIDTRRGAGVKRTGTNRVSSVGDYIELLSPKVAPSGVASSTPRAILGTSSQSGSCFGDSGGPLLALQSGMSRIVGVSHAGGWTSDTVLSQYSRLRRAENLNFLQDTSTQASLDLFNACWSDGDSLDCSNSEASLQIKAFLRVFRWMWRGLMSLF